jgi:UDP-N-acetylglucosamine 4,6-dehydratase
LSTPTPATIFLTGATGSFGSEFCRLMLSTTDAKLRAYSRGEHTQALLADALRCPERVSYIIGDVRDGPHLARAMHGSSHVVHAAALKVVPKGEVNTREFVKTNVLGTENVVDAAITNGVPRSLLISSDKAVSPLNAYGTCKRLAEYAFLEGNHSAATVGSRFASVRGGNIFASNGSVARKWKVAKEEGWPLIVHGESVTRFHLLMDYWLEFCRLALDEMHGGEIFIPKATAWELSDLAAAFDSPLPANVQPLRPGDKPHEMLYCAEEAHRVKDCGWCFVLEPPEELRQVWNYQPWDGAPVVPSVAYSSDRAPRLSVDELRALASTL